MMAAARVSNQGAAARLQGAAARLQRASTQPWSEENKSLDTRARDGEGATTNERMKKRDDTHAPRPRKRAKFESRLGALFAGRPGFGSWPRSA